MAQVSLMRRGARWSRLRTVNEGGRNRVRTFRNKVTHGDEAIAKGKQGLLRPDAKGVELLGRRLEFSELEARQLHD